jgi:hypothetical protein
MVFLIMEDSVIAGRKAIIKKDKNRGKKGLLLS